MKCMNCGEEFPDVVSAMRHCIGCEGRTDFVYMDMLCITRFNDGESVFYRGKGLASPDRIDVVQRYEHPDEVTLDIAFTDERKAADLIAKAFEREVENNKKLKEKKGNE